MEQLTFVERLEDKETLAVILAECRNKREVLLYLNVQPITYYYRILTSACERHGLTINKATIRSERVKSVVEAYNAFRPPQTSNADIKKKLYKEGLLLELCSNEHCPIKTPFWLGSPITLHLDHIDGDSSNNNINNLRILCLNCHSKTETFAGKQTKINKEKRICLASDCTNEPKRKAIRCKDCALEYRKYAWLDVDLHAIEKEASQGIPVSELIAHTHIEVSLLNGYLYYNGSPYSLDEQEIWEPTGKHKQIWQDKETIIQSITCTSSRKEFFLLLDIKNIQQNRSNLKKALKYHDLPMPWTKELKVTRPGKSLCEYLIKDGPKINTGHLKHQLWRHGYFVKECSIENCSVTSEWVGKPLSLQLDHINGDRHDNRLENLRIICPNCHSQTDTFAGKRNRKSGEASEQGSITKPKPRKKTKEKTQPVIKCSGIKCIQPAEIEMDFCIACEDSNVWPEMEILLSLVQKTSWFTAGKLLGVSDNAVRKHVRASGIETQTIRREGNRRAAIIKYKTGERRLCAAPQCSVLPQPGKRIYCEQCTPVFAQLNIPAIETVQWLISLWGIQAVSKAIGVNKEDLCYFMKLS